MTDASITYRALRATEEYAACVALQTDIWGHDFTEIVPTSILRITQKVGGVAAGAFDATGRLVGFVYGISGVRDGRMAHWSHMLAVRPEVEGEGIGRRLKAFQRRQLLDSGIDVVFWTFDPLVAQNAHFNLNRLGARVVDYVPDMYGTDTGSALHSGLGTDRFVVRWELNAPSVDLALAGRLVTTQGRDAPIVNTTASEPTALWVTSPLPLVPEVRIEVPSDIQSVKAASHEQGLRWRANTRHALLWYLKNGYELVGFGRSGGESTYCYYLRSTSTK